MVGIPSLKSSAASLFLLSLGGLSLIILFSVLIVGGFLQIPRCLMNVHLCLRVRHKKKKVLLEALCLWTGLAQWVRATFLKGDQRINMCQCLSFS